MERPWGRIRLNILYVVAQNLDLIRNYSISTLRTVNFLSIQFLKINHARLRLIWHLVINVRSGSFGRT